MSTTEPSRESALDELDRITIELVGRGVMSERGAQKVMLSSRSSVSDDVVAENLALYRKVLQGTVTEQHEAAVYNLSPQLVGLEGWQVEVVDEEGDEPRRFLVARSRGWAPQHWEIVAMATNDRPARREYHSVEQIKKVLP